MEMEKVSEIFTKCKTTNYTIASRFYITRLRRSKKGKFSYHKVTLDLL